MKQYCRYCSHCMMGDFVYCEIFQETMSEEKAKRANTCNKFELYGIDIFTGNTYKPRKKKVINQEKLF